MASVVIHQPRVAWDVAQTVVFAAAAGEEFYGWFGARLGELLGDVFRQNLRDTRVRLARSAYADVRQVELGVWRVRLEDVLRTRPHLADDLIALRVVATSGRRG
jgi:hypothetical protein